MELELELQLDMGLRMLAAIILGGVVGFERERRGHDAGLGTFSMVTLGACVFSMVSDLVFADASDNTRIASGVVEGIGFLGAGLIIHNRSGGVDGLTTAAALWVTASVGMLLGYGLYVLAVLTTVGVLLVLTVRHFGPIARRLEAASENGSDSNPI